MREIVVIAEYLDNKTAPITDELISCAVQISAIVNRECKGVESKVSERIKVLHVKGINPLESENYKSCLADLLNKINPSFVLMGHTAQGVDVAPGLSVRLGYECITGVNGIILPDENYEEKYVESCTKNGAENYEKNIESRSDILFSRSVFKGKLNAIVQLKNSDAAIILTIQPGSFPLKEEFKKECEIKEISLEPAVSTSNQIEYKGIIETHAAKSKLDQAKIIVSAGRGIKDKENLEYIEKMALCFTGSAVAGSRPLIDMGWLPYSQQVGITGAAVAPELYIAVGISGSSQHIAGMKDSKLIVSINKDPNAAIFNFSDICIVEESINFVEAFTKIADKK